MFFAIVDDPEGPSAGPARGLVPRPPGLRGVHRLGSCRRGSPRSSSGVRRGPRLSRRSRAGLGVILDASVFVYLGVLLAAIAAPDRAPAAARDRPAAPRSSRSSLSRAGVSCYAAPTSRTTSGVPRDQRASKTRNRASRRDQQRMMLSGSGGRCRDPPVLGVGFDRRNRTQPYLAARKRKFPGQPAIAYRRRRTRGASRTTGSSSPPTPGTVGLLLGLATFGAGLVLAFSGCAERLRGARRRGVDPGRGGDVERDRDRRGHPDGRRNVGRARPRRGLDSGCRRRAGGA